MPTIIVSVDLECSRCRAKIQRVLNRIQGLFALACYSSLLFALPFPLVQVGLETVRVDRN
jgi:uncharacterized paraquat-inducible protein A